MKTSTNFLAICFAVASASPAFAHSGFPGLGHGGIAAGFAHPWLGLDHLLSMVMVGLLAAWIGKSAIWQLPVAFLVSMFLGGLSGLAEIQLPGIEVGIALSMVLLGLALLAGRSYPKALAVLISCGMGLAHGHVHGTEMAATANVVQYFAGFLLATAVLQMIGLIVGRNLTLLPAERGIAVARFSGIVVAVTGVICLVTRI